MTALPDGRAEGAPMSPTEYGIYLAALEPPISDEQAERAARILSTVEQVAA